MGSIFRKNLHLYNLVENKPNFNSVIQYFLMWVKELNSLGVSKYLIATNKSNNQTKHQEGTF